MASPAILRACLETIHYTGLSKLLRPKLQGLGSIFCFHHICPGGGLQTGFAPNGKLECTPEFLTDIIDLVRKRGMETLSLGDAVERLRNPQHGQKPFAVFTLDDGYKDNAQFGQPVFDELNCPYTVFVAPKIVDGSCELWWRALELVIAQNDRFKIDIAAESFDLGIRTENQKWSAWDQLVVKLAAMPEYAQRETTRAMAKQYGIDLTAYCKSVAMTWDEIRNLNRDPLCTIGAHTMNHYSVGKLNTEDCKYELGQSKKTIEQELGQPVRYFAYPYGDEPAAGPRDFAIAQNAGYEASVTTRKGTVFPGHAPHLQALPRIMVSGRYQKIRYIDALISGAPTALLNRFSTVNVS
jgi:peptidoglycan/xylan/chitin deacetylase (PgdA/CDA1 family)